MERFEAPPDRQGVDATGLFLSRVADRLLVAECGEINAPAVPSDPTTIAPSTTFVHHSPWVRPRIPIGTDPPGMHPGQSAMGKCG